jgi:hypothetical protein
MALPTVGAWFLGSIGLGMLISTVVFWALLPGEFGPSGHLMVNGVEMPLHFGSCFWICFAVGIWTALVGFGIRAYHFFRPEEFFTDFEVDYDALDEKRKHGLALVLVDFFSMQNIFLKFV